MKIQKNLLLTINDELLPKPVCRSTLLIQSMVNFKPIKAVKNTPARIMWKIWYCECISLYRRSLRVSPSPFRYQIRIDFEHIDHYIQCMQNNFQKLGVDQLRTRKFVEEACSFLVLVYNWPNTVRFLLAPYFKKYFSLAMNQSDEIFYLKWERYGQKQKMHQKLWMHFRRNISMKEKFFKPWWKIRPII